MSIIIQADPSTFKEVVKEQVWKDAMSKEYESIMENDIWDVVPRPKIKEYVCAIMKPNVLPDFKMVSSLAIYYIYLLSLE